MTPHGWRKNPLREITRRGVSGIEGMAHMLTGSMACLAAASALMSVSVAQETAPMLGQPPYPPGYTRPVSLPATSALKVVEEPEMPVAFCAYFDVDTDGSVSNVHALLSTGSQANDGALVKWFGELHYEPATWDGSAIRVRILRGTSLGQMPPEKANYCRWDMYHPEG